MDANLIVDMLNGAGMLHGKPSSTALYCAISNILQGGCISYLVDKYASPLPWLLL